MLKKVFLQTQFGTPHKWTEEYFKNVAILEQTGWYFKVFTPHKYENVPNNVEIVPMTVEEFDVLVQKKLDIKPGNFLKDGYPSKHISDFYVAMGLIFEDYLKDVDFWGMTNWDVVYGRLSHFVPDALLEQCDIFSDDVRTINGVFTLMRNNEKVNNLFRKVRDWELKLSTHQLYGIDELDFTEVCRNSPEVMWFFPVYYPMCGHDRLVQHYPEVKLSIKEDGSLFELSEDMGSPEWAHARPVIGREVPYFHFIRTKEWPKCL